MFAHIAFNDTTFAVDAVERARQLIGARRVIGQQAFNAQRHIRQAPGGVDARPQGKAKVKGRGLGRLATRSNKKRCQPFWHGQRTHAFEALRDQAPVICV